MIKREGRITAFLAGLLGYCLATFLMENRGISLKGWVQAYSYKNNDGDVTTNIHEQTSLSSATDVAENQNHSASTPLHVFNKTSASFAGCMMLKEDNHWLSEWIPYHYQTARLRHLLVVEDSSSRTSPNHILDRWKVRERWKVASIN